MKTRFYQAVRWSGTVGLALLMGCANQSAQQAKVQTAPSGATPVAQAELVSDGLTQVVTDPSPPILFTSSVPASVAAQRGPQPAAPTSDEPSNPAIQERVEPAPPVGSEGLSPAVGEVVKMARAGVGEDVLLAYVENSRHGFNLNSDGIVYLNDLGVSAAVVTAMIQRDAQLGAMSTVTTPAESAAAAAQTQAVSNVPVTSEPVAAEPVSVPVEAAPAVEAAAPQTVYVAAPAQQTQVAYFYDSLAPYGSWMYVSGYGWCWQPTVVVSTAGWTPYCDAGRWYWSDAGWYWHSDYSWGWAPFHYGRWFCHGRAGWLWTPGTVWGPSWVSWRYAPGYCGWAPLPPAAHWSVGVGFSYHGVRVGIGCDFGLSYAHYSWVSANRFCDYNLRRHRQPHDWGRDTYHNSTVVNNYVVNKTTTINHGVGRDTIARSAGGGLRTVTVRERPAERVGPMRPERMLKEGSKLVVERPTLPKTTPAMPAAVARYTPGRTDAASVGGTSGLNSQDGRGLRNGPSATPASRVGASAGTARLTPSKAELDRAPFTAKSSALPATEPSGKPEVKRPAEPRIDSGLRTSEIRVTRTDKAASSALATPKSDSTSAKSATAEQSVKPERPVPGKSIVMYGPSKSTVPEITTPAAVTKPETPTPSKVTVVPTRPVRSSEQDAKSPLSTSRPDRKNSASVEPSASAKPFAPRVEPTTSQTTPPGLPAGRMQPAGRTTSPNTTPALRPSSPGVSPSAPAASRSTPSFTPAPSSTPTQSRSTPAYTPPSSRSTPSFTPAPRSSPAPVRSSPSFTPAPSRSTPASAPAPSRSTPSFTPAPRSSPPASTPSGRSSPSSGSGGSRSERPSFRADRSR